MTTFVILAKRYPGAKLVFTGGSGAIEQGVSNEAEYARILLEQLGLPPDRVVFETTSRTTWENAVNTYALVKPQPSESWILLTSASHMPRAVGVFRKLGGRCCHGRSATSLATTSALSPSLRAQSLGCWTGRHMNGLVWRYIICRIGPPRSSRRRPKSNFSSVCPTSGEPEKAPCKSVLPRFSILGMIRAGFLDPELRRDLIDLGRDGSVAHRLAGRANALVLLDDGMHCGDVARGAAAGRRHRPHLVSIVSGRRHRRFGGLWFRRQRVPVLSDAQQDRLKSWIAETLPGQPGRSAPGSRPNAASPTRAGVV